MIGSLLLFILLNPTFASSGEFTLKETVNGTMISDRDPATNLEIQFPWSTDPFVKAAGHVMLPEVTEPDFVLQATIAEGRTPSAILNDRTVRVGDEVGGRIVKRIGDNFVLLERGGSVIEIGLYDHQNGRPAQQQESQLSEGSISIEEIHP